jgi:outer membrane protein OmpA-like peptidoglycan-associated protein
MKAMFLTFPALALAACATTKNQPSELTRAHEEYDAALASPAKDLAPTELYTAQKLLSAAKRSYEKYGGAAVTSDWAYLARRQTEIAIVRANAVRNMQCAAAHRSAARIERDAQLKTARVALDQANQATQAKEQQQATLEQQLPKEVEVRHEERGTIVTMPGSVLFATGVAELSPISMEQLGKVADALKSSTGEEHIIIEGHTDNVGSHESNQRLSLARAIAVEEFLISRGVPRERLEAKGYGETRPLVDNTTPENRADNRRVEIVIQAPKPVS